MPTLVIVAGIPGCGKSTWAKHFLERKYVIVSTDDIRRREFGSLKAAHAAEANEKIFAEFHRQIEDALVHNIDVVADATSLTAESRLVLRDIADRANARTHLVLFKNVQQALDRNVQRDEDARVPTDVMEHMLLKYRDTLADIAREHYDHVTKIESVS